MLTTIMVCTGRFRMSFTFLSWFVISPVSGDFTGNEFGVGRLKVTPQLNQYQNT